MLSERFKIALLKRRAAGVKMYHLAYEVGLHPSVFSAVCCESVPLKHNDPRVIKIGAVLGLRPEHCFNGRRPRRRKVGVTVR